MDSAEGRGHIGLGALFFYIQDGGEKQRYKDERQRIALRELGFFTFPYFPRTFFPHFPEGQLPHNEYDLLAAKIMTTPMGRALSRIIDPNRKLTRL